MPRWPSEALRNAVLDASRTSQALAEELCAVYEVAACRKAGSHKTEALAAGLPRSLAAASGQD